MLFRFFAANPLRFRLLVLAVTSLAVLTSAASCTLPGLNLGLNQETVTYGVLKRDPSIRESFGRINTVKNLNGEDNSNGLLDVSTQELLQLTPNNLFLLTENRGLYETENGGRFWERKYIYPVGSDLSEPEQRNAEITAQVVANNNIATTDLEISERNPNIMFVAGTVNRIGKIWRSENAGRTFQEVHSEISPGNSIVGVQIDARQDNVVYALLEGGVLIRSNDSGDSWTKIQDFSQNAVQLGVVPEFDDLLFILFSRDGYVFSRDRGESWEEVELSREASQIGESQTKDFTIRSSLFDPASFGRFERLIPIRNARGSWLLLADNQIWYTDDLAQPFIKMVLPLTEERYEVASVAVDPAAGVDRVLVSIDDNLFQTQNRGRSWSTSDLIGLNTQIGNINSIVIDEQNPNVVYLGLQRD